MGDFSWDEPKSEDVPVKRLPVRAEKTVTPCGKKTAKGRDQRGRFAARARTVKADDATGTAESEEL